MAERLPPSPWMTAPGALAVIAALEAAGGEGCARFVGGCVRDTLLGRGDQVTDVDIATPLTPPQVTAALEAAGLKAVPTGVEHGTVTAVVRGVPYEITTLRRDVETDGRRAVVAFTTDWAQDAQRRDFRLNALYADPDGVIHDPTGGGLADVAARRIVFVGDPETRIREDYLRILRFFRFLARVGDAAQADPAGLEACARLKDGVAGLSGERIRQELFKLLGSDDPVPAVWLMQSSGVLHEALPGAQGTGALGEMVFQDQWLGHSDTVQRLIALIEGDNGARLATARLRLTSAVATRLRDVFGITPHDLTPGTSPSELRALIYGRGAQAVEDRIRLRAADALEQEPEDWVSALDLARTWSPPPFPVTGEEIKALGVPEGPKVGEVRRALKQWWIDGDFTATKAQALDELERLAPAFRADSP